MLSKTARLNRQEFSAAFATGKRIHTPQLQIIVSKSNQFHGCIVVPKKIYKKAVDRNRIRRQLYAFLYQYNKTHLLENTLILIAKPAFSAVPLQQVKENLALALQNVS